MWKRLKSTWQRVRVRMTRGMVWDLFMVYLALVNVGLILFDLTYLWLRPAYFHYMPVVTRIYDPVKGIEPEPVTERYLELAAGLPNEAVTTTSLYRVETSLAELRELSLEIIDDNPFSRSGLEKNRIRLFKGMELQLASEGLEKVDGDEAEDLTNLYWSLAPESSHLGPRVVFFQQELAPLLKVNYYRSYDPEGNLVDNFWLIDLPFWLIFVVEFFTRWYLAIRRRTYPRWFFFVLFNWYDLLGILPFKQMRLFRLLRVISIYVRLHKSEHSAVGDDPISRTVKYIANIITEEISDMVALRILNETQEELREGAHKSIIRSVADEHRDALAQQLSRRVRDLLTNNEVREQARAFLDANLDQAVENAEALRRLPLPDAILRPLVNTIGQVVFDTFADTLAATMSTQDGQSAVETMIRDAIDGLVVEITDGELEEIVREISIQVIDQMKDTVAVRKWALPDQPSRSLLTRDLVD